MNKREFLYTLMDKCLDDLIMIKEAMHDMDDEAPIITAKDLPVKMIKLCDFHVSDKMH